MRTDARASPFINRSYSQISVTRQAAIIECFESSSGIDPALDAAVDESNVRSVLHSNRKYWRGQLGCEGIRISPVVSSSEGPFTLSAASSCRYIAQRISFF